MSHEQSNPATKPKARPVWQPRLSCWILAAIPLGLAWVLVAMPGNQFFSSYDSVRSEGRIHGWPLTHAVSIRTDYPEAVAFQEFKLTSTAQALELLQKRMDNHAQSLLADSQELAAATPIFNLRLVPAAPELVVANRGFRGRSIGLFPFTVFKGLDKPPFWSNLTNWPIRNTHQGFAVEWFILPFTCNLLILILAIYFTACLLQLRLNRRGSWLKLSVFELLFAAACLAIVVASLKTEFDRATRERQAITNFETLTNGFPIFETVLSRRDYVPPLLLELFNNQRSLPGTDVPLGKPLTAVRIDLLVLLFFSGDTPDFPKQLADVAAQLECPVYLDVPHVALDELSKFDPCNIEQLGYTFHDPMVLEETQTKLVNVLDGFTNLSNIQLMLAESSQQEHQLQPFFQTSIIHSLESFEIWNVTESGAEFLLTVEDEIARKIKLKPAAAFSEELSAKLRSKGIVLVDRDFHY